LHGRLWRAAGRLAPVLPPLHLRRHVGAHGRDIGQACQFLAAPDRLAVLLDRGTAETALRQNTESAVTTSLTSVCAATTAIEVLMLQPVNVLVTIGRYDAAAVSTYHVKPPQVRRAAVVLAVPLGTPPTEGAYHGVARAVDQAVESIAAQMSSIQIRRWHIRLCAWEVKPGSSSSHAKGERIPVLRISPCILKPALGCHFRPPSRHAHDSCKTGYGLA
jgi:hypothetical protein